MADPAKTPEEIEDVLASIRRLVSEEPSGQARAVARAEPAHPEPSPIERLVLTPSLRVSDPVETDAQSLEDDGHQDQDDAANVFEDGGTEVSQAEQSDDLVDRLEEDPEAALQLADDALRDIEGAPDSALLEILSLDGAADDALHNGDAQPDHSDWQPEDRLAEYDAVGQASDEDAPEQTAEVVELDAALGQLASDVEDFSPESSEHGDVLDLAGARMEDSETSSDHAAEEDVAELDASENELAEDDAASEADIADLIRLDGEALETAEFESDTGDENWPEDNAEAALLSLVARRPAAPEALEDEGSSGDQPAGESAVADAEDAVDPTEEPLSERKDVLARAVEVVASAETSATNDETTEAEDETAASTDESEATIADALQTNVPATPVFSRRHRAAAAAAAAAAEDAATQHPEASEDTTAGVDDETSLWAPFENIDDVLDEEALREIIADVVREELQGVLGQRITRNVRKMVRREIRLALAAEDLD